VHASSSTSSSDPTSGAGDRTAFLQAIFRKVLPVLTLPAIYCLLIMMADPYNYFRLPVSISGPEVRAKFAAPANPSLFQFLAFRANPKPDIVLGDSRIGVLAPQAIREQTGLDFAGLSIAGATFDTILEAFWLASDLAPLRTVVLGVSLDSYNDFRIGDEVTAVRGILHNPLLYLVNRNVVDASVQAYKDRLGLGVATTYQLSGVDRNAIWQGTLKYYESSLRNYRDPVRFRRRLRQVSQHCRGRGIRLRFVILPQHDDATELIDRYGLSKALGDMKAELAEMGELIDLSAASHLTADRSRFVDIIHFGPEKDFGLIRRIWPSEAGHSSTRSDTGK
jgi:hypothetical protein